MSTSASWLNQVARYPGQITTRRIRRGSYFSIKDLEDAIYVYLLHHSADQSLRLTQFRRRYPHARTPRAGRPRRIRGNR